MLTMTICNDCGSERAPYTKIDEAYFITNHCEDCWVIIHEQEKDQ